MYQNEIAVSVWNATQVLSDYLWRDLSPDFSLPQLRGHHVVYGAHVIRAHKRIVLPLVIIVGSEIVPYRFICKGGMSASICWRGRSPKRRAVSLMPVAHRSKDGGNPLLFESFCGQKIVPARYTSRPEARGSGPEAVFRFLGSGVDSHAKKGEKGPRVGSSGREFA